MNTLECAFNHLSRQFLELAHRIDLAFFDSKDPNHKKSLSISKRKHISVAHALLAGCTILLAGCAASPTTPVATLNYQTDPDNRQPHLIVLIRGIGEDHRVFEKEGMIDEIRKRNLPFDVSAPDLHFGYYQPDIFETRLKEDVIDPARRQGYKQIWLAGFSMGGLGSLIYLRKHPNDVDGVMLITPFLGWPEIHREIRRAGGIDDWKATGDEPSDWQRMLWSWIKQRDFASQPPIWMGYGNRDIVSSKGPEMLAERMPQENVIKVSGGHSLGTMRRIFLHQLDRLAERIENQPATLAMSTMNPTTVEQ